MLEVIGVKSILDFAKIHRGFLPPLRLGQASKVRIELGPGFENVMQIDGEVIPVKGPGVIEVTFKSQINCLKYEP